MNAATKTLPLLNKSLISLARELRKVPTDLKTLADAQAAQVSELTRRTPFNRDALLPDPMALYYTREASTVQACLDAWAAQRNTASATDSTADWQNLRIDPRDGSLFRLGGVPMPLTLHALQQLVGVLTAGGSGFRSAVSALEWSSPASRSMILAELLATSKRKPSEPVIIRTALLRDENGQGRVAPEFSREIRAIVTPRHALGHFDDAVLSERIGKLARAGAPMWFQRSPHAAETRGWVEVGAGKVSNHSLREVVSFRNSETGQARLGFWGSARIVAIDELVTAPGVSTTGETEVAAVSGDRHERNHTLPTVGTKDLAEKYGVRADGKLSEGERRSIAEQRIDESYATATARARELALNWGKALESFPAGFDPGLADARHLPKAEVMMDLLSEHGLAPTEQRDALMAVFNDEERIQSLPWGSAAYVAAAFAVLASRGVTGEGGKVQLPTWQDAHKLQVAAGRWVLCRWDVKAHRSMVGGEE